MRATPWTTVLEHKHEPERGDHRTARRRRLGLGPQGTPGRSRRAQRAQRALPDTGGVRAQGTPLPAHDAPAEHVRVPPKGPLGPPAPRGPRVEPRGARAGHSRALRVAQAVPGDEAHRAKMDDVHAGHALQGLIDPTVSWGTLGAPRDCGVSLAKDAPSLGFLPPPSPRRHPWITPANRGEQRVDTEQNKLQRARAARVLQGCNCSSESPTTKML